LTQIGTFEVTLQYFAYFISISSLVFENDKWTFGGCFGHFNMYHDLNQKANVYVLMLYSLATLVATLTVTTNNVQENTNQIFYCRVAKMNIQSPECFWIIFQAVTCLVCQGDFACTNTRNTEPVNTNARTQLMYIVLSLRIYH